jgi:hypothetical protein
MEWWNSLRPAPNSNGTSDILNGSYASESVGLFGRGLASTPLREASGPTDLPCGNFKHAGQFSYIGEFRRLSDKVRQEGHPLETELRLVARVKLNLETIEEEEAMEHGLGLRTPDSEVRP